MADRRLIHIIDDEEAIRSSVGFMLMTSGFDVETWPSGVAFLKGALTAPQGCILLDLRMPEMDGLEVQQTLLDRGITLPVIMLTGHGDIPIAVRAMRAGAVDFLEKPFEKTRLLDAIESAFARLEDKAARADRAQQATAIIASLTAREQEVLKGLAQGLLNKTIASDLGISSRTVEVHRANLMNKLKVRTLSEALQIAFAAGISAER